MSFVETVARITPDKDGSEFGIIGIIVIFIITLPLGATLRQGFLFKEAFIMTHNHLAFNLLNSFKSNTNKNDD